MFIIEKIKELSKGDHIAAISQEGSLSYRDLESRSEAIAAYLLQNFPGNDPVIIWCDKENDALSSLIACLKSGRSYLLAADYLTESRIRTISAHCDAKLCISLSKNKFPADLPALLDQTALDTVCREYGSTPVDCRHWSKPDDMACLFYTSGSTGIPKGVSVLVRNVEAMAKWWGSQTDPDIPHPRMLNFTPYSFSASLATIYNGLGRLGATLYAVDKSLSGDYPRLFRYILDVQPHLFDCTPSFAEICLRDEQFCSQHLPSLKVLSVGGEPLTHKIGRLLLDAFPDAKILNGYGATETTIGNLACTVTMEQVLDDLPLPIGYPSENSRVYVVDENGNILPDGQTGELIIECDMISAGYYKDPERTKENFFTTPEGAPGYNTKDLAWIKDGLVYYVGRANNLVKVCGYRVEIEEVERVISQSDAVSICAIAPAEEDGRTVMLVAYVVLSPGSKAGMKTTIALKKEAAQTLPHYMLPQKFIYLDHMVYNVNGKIDRAALKKMSRIQTDAN